MEMLAWRAGLKSSHYRGGSADGEFEQLLLAIVRNLPLRHPTILSARAVRRIIRVTDGVTSREVFRTLNSPCNRGDRNRRRNGSPKMRSSDGDQSPGHELAFA